jgi:hypothetical protein
VRVVDFIHGVARKVFGKSFHQDHRNDWNNIDLLFQCRNKIAHTGQLSYEGQPPVTYEVVAHWWDSVRLLIGWLIRFLFGSYTYLCDALLIPHAAAETARRQALPRMTESADELQRRRKSAPDLQQRPRLHALSLVARGQARQRQEMAARLGVQRHRVAAW